ncbi:MAG: hypothetical protein Q9160_006520 [Pyrenula sp. 1 TL-2023]
MKKFGRSKKDEGGDEDSNRLALFGSRSKSKSPAPPENPYAKNFPPDPYTQAKVNAGVAPPPPSQRQGAPGRGLPSGPKSGGGFPAGPRAGYGGMNSPPPAGSQNYGSEKKYGYGGNQGGYGAEKYGNQGGYGGDNPYGGQKAETNRPGGYGGLGADVNGTDDSREALFGGARDRYQQQQQSRPPPYDDGQSQGDYGPNERSYGAYGDRQLTQEEEEAEEIEAQKQDIRSMKRSDVSSTRNALRIAEQAEMSGRDVYSSSRELHKKLTAARHLPDSGRKANAFIIQVRSLQSICAIKANRSKLLEKNLDLASNANKVAQDKVRGPCLQPLYV